MPLYEYRCRGCGRTSEVWHGFGERHLAPCSECGDELLRVFHPVGIVFKGSGFYKNDSRKASTKSETSAGSGKASTDGASGEKMSSEKTAGEKSSTEQTSSEKSSQTAPKPQ